MTDTTHTVRTDFRIPSENFPKLRAAFDHLAKRAEKLGQVAPKLTVVGEVTETITNGPAWLTDTVQTFILVKVEGEAPGLEGWKMTAVVDMTDDPHLVHVMGDAKVAPALHTVENRCDHCGFNRGRNKLVEVKHTSGERKLVGTTCLADFLGHDSPTSLASWAELIFELDDFVSDFEERLVGVPMVVSVTAESALLLTASLVHTRGWLSKGKAMWNGGVATARIVELAMLGDDAELRRLGVLDDVERAEVTDADRKLVADALAWARSIPLTSDSDYLRNVAVVAQREAWGPKELGLGCSILTAYQRVLDDLAEKAKVEEVAKVSRFVGTEGVREHFGPLHVDRLRYFDGDYGLRTLVSMTDEDGNVLVWWASGEGKLADKTAIAEGMTVRGKATVKRHETYKGVAQTTINRPRFEEVS